MAAVRLHEVSGRFPGGPLVVDHVSFELATGEFFCLLGPSGCGKSTLLRLIGGYQSPERGEIRINDRDVTREPPERRNTGMVFQNYALFPHLDALDNVAFGLRVKGMSKKDRHLKANEMLDWVGLTQDERHRLPARLSGGQQQRVALARALAFGPSLLMLDEPFANLDRSLRERLREEMREVQRRAGITTILVTHDREEALALGDRIAVMRQGRLLQMGTPGEVYRSPCSAEVAIFLGHHNVLNPEAAAKCGLRGEVLLRPGLLRMHADGWLPAVIRRSVFNGSHRVLTLTLDNGIDLEVLTFEETGYQVNQRVGLEIPDEAVTVISGA